MRREILTAAIAVDRNEIDELAPTYLGFGVAFGGIGALIGWASMPVGRSHMSDTIARHRMIPRHRGGIAPAGRRGVP